MRTLGEEFNIIAGPCAIESSEQIETVASFLSQKGIKYLRGGAFKPRTSINSFQGLGKEGLKLLSQAARKYNMLTVSEILDVRELEQAMEYIDIVQIGSRSMQNFPLLMEAGKLDKPVLLKRGFMSTTEEFICAGEYILKGGNHRLIFCERGIRSFDPRFKAIIDFQGAAQIKAQTDSEVIIDLSHALFDNSIIIPLARAARALGVDGIMLEVHPQPQHSLSDKNQLNFEQFISLKDSL